MSLTKKSYIVVALMSALAFSAVAPTAHAQSTDITVATLMARITSLKAQIESLKSNATTPVKDTTTPALETDSGVVVTKTSVSSGKPSITGTAEDAKTLYVSVTKDGASKPVLQKTVKVKRDKWSLKGSKKLADGAYTISVYAKKSSKEALATKTFTVGKATAASANGSFSVSLVPLLMGGSARAGQSVPVSYLKVQNTGKETATLTGVTLAQRGSAAANAVASLTIKDDKDGSQGQVSVSGTSATIPTTSVFAPGQIKLFTIRAVLSQGAGAQLGRTLQYEVTGVTGGKGAFPIKGTTWTIGL